jgi:pimeloyl-ACP methyl ester carboxylesterase
LQNCTLSSKLYGVQLMEALMKRNEPRIDRTVECPDGRRIGVAEFGSADGAAVVFLHRSPGSRLLDPDPAATAQAGVRLICVDRPGYGATDPVAAPTRAAAADDLEAVVDALGLEEVALVGWSGGGQFAVEAAARPGVRARSLTLLATPGPYYEVPWAMPPDLVVLCDRVPDDPAAGLAAAREAMGWFAESPQAGALGDPSPADAAARERPGVADALVAMAQEGARQGVEGIAFDIVAGSLRDPFPFDAIDVPVDLFGGDADLNVGLEHVDWWAERLGDTRRHVLPETGHLLAVTHWREVLAALR